MEREIHPMVHPIGEIHPMERDLHPSRSASLSSTSGSMVEPPTGSLVMTINSYAYHFTSKYSINSCCSVLVVSYYLVLPVLKVYMHCQRHII